MREDGGCGRIWEKRGTACRIGLGKLTFTHENIYFSGGPPFQVRFMRGWYTSISLT